MIATSLHSKGIGNPSLLVVRIPLNDEINNRMISFQNDGSCKLDHYEEIVTRTALNSQHLFKVFFTRDHIF